MRPAQHTADWEARFRREDTPWEDTAVAPAVAHLFEAYVPTGATVVEVGCGLGTTALWLARRGYRVTACDISAAAIRHATIRAAAQGLAVDFRVVDVLAAAPGLPRPAVVYDRGVLHTFVDAAGRQAFATAVARLLDRGGLWLDVSGSADTPGDPAAAAHGLPRLTLAEIAMAAEPHFEALAVQRVSYGETPGRTDFLAFACAFRRR